MLQLPSLAVFLSVATISKATSLERRGPDPLGKVEPGTAAGCTWWYENKDGSLECRQVPAIMEIPFEEWLAWVSFTQTKEKN